MEWLAGPGYTVAGLSATARGGPVAVLARGGAVVHEGGRQGAQGRASVGVGGAVGPRLGLYGLGAGLDPVWVAGGGVEAGFRTDAWRVQGDAGWFRYRPLDGRVAPVSEVRLLAGPSLVAEEGGLDLSLTLSAGSDRLLEQWASAGFVLAGRLGGDR
jgi:hypothetical protein